MLGETGGGKHRAPPARGELRLNPPARGIHSPFTASSHAVVSHKTLRDESRLGTTDNTTITATPDHRATGKQRVKKRRRKLVAFKQGAPSTSKQVGQIPANYKQGSGTIVSGTAANKATRAALAAYPGGIVDRVVKLSNGEYEVHNIGVNWPHHIFVNRDFKVVGAG